MNGTRLYCCLCSWYLVNVMLLTHTYMLFLIGCTRTLVYNRSQFIGSILYKREQVGTTQRQSGFATANLMLTERHKHWNRVTHMQRPGWFHFLWIMTQFWIRASPANMTWHRFIRGIIKELRNATAVAGAKLKHHCWIIQKAARGHLHHQLPASWLEKLHPETLRWCC